MKKVTVATGALFSSLLILGFLSFLLVITACIPPVVPEFSGEAPKPIYSSTQIGNAIELALAGEGWDVVSVKHHGIITARKQVDTKSASVHIVYGYQGYSMEYAHSQNMHYSASSNTIDPKYRSWVYALNAAIQYQLNQKAKELRKRLKRME